MIRPSKPRSLFWLFGLAVLLWMTAASAWAAQVTLAWDASSPQPDGYKLFERTDSQTAYDYTQPVWTGSTTTCTVGNLQSGTHYHFVVRAYNATADSADSNEVSYDTPAADNAPTANAGADQTVNGTSQVTLNGSGSTDPDGDTLSYTWTQTSGTTVRLSNPQAAQPTFTAPAATSSALTLVFTLTVSDPSGLTSTDTCQVVIKAANQAPVAQAGPDQSVLSGDSVRLNGTGSYDPEGGTLTYRWVQTSGQTVQLSAVNVAQPAFTAPVLTPGQSAQLVFRLTVTDDHNLTGTDTCAVLVTADAPADSGGSGGTSGGSSSGTSGGTSSGTSGGTSSGTSGGTSSGTSGGTSSGTSGGTSSGTSGGASSGTTVQNQPPDQPSLLYPADGDSAVELTPELEASAFADPDAGDTLAQTEWLIQAQSDGHSVLDVTRTGTDLSRLQVPLLVLDPDTAYFCQVRYFDEQGNVSRWSPAVAFTTGDAVTTPLPPAQTDLNADGIADANETDTLKSVQAPDGQHAVAVDIANSDNVTALDAVEASDPSVEQDFPDTASPQPYGLVSYRIHVREPGQQATVALYFSDRLDPDTTWMAQDENDDWTDSSSQVTSQPDGYTVYRQITDGGPGDADGTANGTIVDEIVPLGASGSPDTADQGLTVSDPAGSGSSSSGGGGGCFIGSLMK